MRCVLVTTAVLVLLLAPPAAQARTELAELSAPAKVATQRGVTEADEVAACRDEERRVRSARS